MKNFKSAVFLFVSLFLLANTSSHRATSFDSQLMNSNVLISVKYTKDGKDKFKEIHHIKKDTLNANQLVFETMYWSQESNQPNYRKSYHNLDTIKKYFDAFIESGMQIALDPNAANVLQYKVIYDNDSVFFYAKDGDFAAFENFRKLNNF